MVQARVMFAVERGAGAQRRGSRRGEAVRHARMRVGWRGKGKKNGHVHDNCLHVRVFDVFLQASLVWLGQRNKISNKRENRFGIIIENAEASLYRFHLLDQHGRKRQDCVLCSCARLFRSDSVTVPFQSCI